jgi:formylglycine-generating enzyme required for sulfatase activity
MEMVLIPAGTFTMGSPAGELDRGDYETQHQVTLTKGFYMGKWPVTQAQYEAVMGSNPSIFRNGAAYQDRVAGLHTVNFPVEQVSWYDALVFCNKLSVKEGLTPVYRISGSTDPAAWGTVPTDFHATWNAAEMVDGSNGYRLPTEAQWEYACRAGTTTAFNWGTDQLTTAQANYNGNWDNSDGVNVDGRTTEVGSFAPNAYGLYDMHGNVSEWCWDKSYFTYYSSSPQTDPTGPTAANIGSRISRGGAWLSYGRYSRSAYHGSTNPQYRTQSNGFRLVRP